LQCLFKALLILGLEGQSLKYSVNMVLTCIIYSVNMVLLAMYTVHCCKYTDCVYLCRLHIFRRRETKAGNPQASSETAVALRRSCTSLRRSLTSVWSSFCLSSSMFRSVTPAFVRSGTTQCGCLRVC